MNVTGIFPTPLAHQLLTLDTQPFVDYAVELEQQQPQGVREGGWQSEQLDLKTISPICPLVEQVQLCVNELVEHLWQLDCAATLTQGWINSNQGHAQLANNWSHMHPGNFISLVYYAQVSKYSGDLIIEPPHAWNDYAVPEDSIQELNPWNAQRHHYTPTQGELIAFPSWIKHAAQPNHTNERRISYAFNAQLLESFVNNK